MASVSLDKPNEKTEANDPLTTTTTPSERPPRIQGLGLPPPGSEDWEEVALPPPPGTNRSKSHPTRSQEQ
jgi:hypothetical protein